MSDLDIQLRKAIVAKDLPKVQAVMAARVVAMGPEALDALIEDEEDDEDSFNDYTPLCLAASQGALEICEFLCKEGAQPTLMNPFDVVDDLGSTTPAICAASNGHFEVVKYFIDSGYVSVSGIDGNVILCDVLLSEATADTKRAMICYLLDKGANLWFFDEELHTTIFPSLINHDHADVLFGMLDSVMIERGAPIDYQKQIAHKLKDNDEVVYTLPLLVLCVLSIVNSANLSGILKTIDFLLDMKQVNPAEPIKKGLFKGQSPLDIIAETSVDPDKLPLVTQIKEKFITCAQVVASTAHDPEVLDERALDQALSEAIKTQQLEIVKNSMAVKIQKKGLEALDSPLQICVSGEEPQNYTPLCLAARHNAVAVCQYLCEAGATVTLPQSMGSEQVRPVDIAIRHGSYEALVYFIAENHVSVDKLLLQAISKLSFDPSANQQRIVNYLLDKGANLWEFYDEKIPLLFQNLLLGNNFLKELQVFDELMTRRRTPIDYQKQIAYIDDVSSAERVRVKYSLPILAEAMLMMQNNVTEELVGFICYLLEERKLDLTLPIKMGTFKGQTPLYIFIRCIVLNKHQQEKGVHYNLLLRKILLAKPELLFHEVAFADMPIKLSLAHVLCGDFYARTLADVVTRLTDERIAQAHPFVQAAVLMGGVNKARCAAYFSVSGRVEELSKWTVELSGNAAVQQRQKSGYTRELFRLLRILPPGLRVSWFEAVEKSTLQTLIAKHYQRIEKLRTFFPAEYFPKLLECLNIKSQEEYFALNSQSTHQDSVNKIVCASLVKMHGRYAADLTEEEKANKIKIFRDFIQHHAEKPRPQGIGLSAEDKKIVLDSLDRIDRLQEAITITPAGVPPIRMLVRDSLAFTIHAAMDRNALMSDMKELTDDDIVTRFATLAKYLIESYREYPDLGLPACFHGMFNKPVESLQAIHPDVPFIKGDNIEHDIYVRVFKNICQNMTDFVCDQYLNLANQADGEKFQQAILQTWDEMATSQDDNTAAKRFVSILATFVRTKSPQITVTDLATLMENIQYVPLVEIYGRFNTVSGEGDDKSNKRAIEDTSSEQTEAETKPEAKVARSEEPVRDAMQVHGLLKPPAAAPVSAPAQDVVMESAEQVQSGCR